MTNAQVVSNVDFSSVIAEAVKDNPNLASALEAMKANATVPVSGKIKLAAPAPAAKAVREDAREPNTIIPIAMDKATGETITLGYSKTTKDERGRKVNYGFGLEVVDPETGRKTMIFHQERKWKLLALYAPLVAAAIDEHYER